MEKFRITVVDHGQLSQKLIQDLIGRESGFGTEEPRSSFKLLIALSLIPSAGDPSKGVFATKPVAGVSTLCRPQSQAWSTAQESLAFAG